MHPEGRPCRCGARGCWETEIGGPAIARALGLGPVSTEELVHGVRTAVAGGDPGLDVVAHHLGLGLASVVNIVNPRLVIMGGLLRELFPATEHVVRASLDAAALTAPAEQVALVTPELGGDAVLVGASELAWQDVLDDPAAMLRRRHRFRTGPVGRAARRRAADPRADRASAS